MKSVTAMQGCHTDNGFTRLTIFLVLSFLVALSANWLTLFFFFFLRQCAPGIRISEHMFSL